jgi:hypothetical protein
MLCFRIHAQAVISEVKESLIPMTLVPAKPGQLGHAYTVRDDVSNVPVHDGPGFRYKVIGKLGKGSTVHALVDQVSWIKSRLGWSPKKDENRRPLLERIVPRQHNPITGSPDSDDVCSTSNAAASKALDQVGAAVLSVPVRRS